MRSITTMSPFAVAIQNSILFGVIWDLKDVVALVTENAAAHQVAHNISWWFQNVFGVLAVVAAYSRILNETPEPTADPAP